MSRTPSVVRGPEACLPIPGSTLTPGPREDLAQHDCCAQFTKGKWSSQVQLFPLDVGVVGRKGVI